MGHEIGSIESAIWPIPFCCTAIVSKQADRLVAKASCSTEALGQSLNRWNLLKASDFCAGGFVSFFRIRRFDFGIGFAWEFWPPICIFAAEVAVHRAQFKAELDGAERIKSEGNEE